jgi:hypothetical protein
VNGKFKTLLTNVIKATGEEEVDLPLLIASFRPWAVLQLTFDQSHVCEKKIKCLAWVLLSSVE